MNDAILPYSPPRTLESLWLEIHERRRDLAMLRDLAGEFAALDVRPLIITDEGVQRLGDFKIPPELVALIQEESEAIASLTRAYIQRRASEKLPDQHFIQQRVLLALQSVRSAETDDLPA